MFTISAITFPLLFHPYPHCVWLEIVCEFFKYSFKCKKCAEGKRNYYLRQSSVRFCQLLKEKASFQQESWYLQEQLAAINDKMIEIEDLEDKMILVKHAVDNNNQETIEFFTLTSSSTTLFLLTRFLLLQTIW